MHVPANQRMTTDAMRRSMRVLQALKGRDAKELAMALKVAIARRELEAK